MNKRQKETEVPCLLLSAMTWINKEYLTQKEIRELTLLAKSFMCVVYTINDLYWTLPQVKQYNLQLDLATRICTFGQDCLNDVPYVTHLKYWGEESASWPDQIPINVTYVKTEQSKVTKKFRDTIEELVFMSAGDVEIVPGTLPKGLKHLKLPSNWGGNISDLGLDELIALEIMLPVCVEFDPSTLPRTVTQLTIQLNSGCNVKKESTWPETMNHLIMYTPTTDLLSSISGVRTITFTVQNLGWYVPPFTLPDGTKRVEFNDQLQHPAKFCLVEKCKFPADLEEIHIHHSCAGKIKNLPKNCKIYLH